MGVNKIIFSVSGGLLLLAGIIIYSLYNKSNFSSRSESASTTEVSIERQWELPKKLAEISGIAFLDKNRFVGVQDEEGKLFIYDLTSSKIEKEINFGSNGDYEGIALKGKTAFILRSDGTVFKVENFLTDPKVEENPTRLSRKQDAEGLCYDKQNNRLLIAIKEEDPTSEDSKSIFALNLTDMKLRETPALRLTFDDKIFDSVRENKLQNTFKPSEINIHPHTGEIYMLEGQKPKLLILDKEGKAKKLYLLDKDKFPQPEGITFDDSGNIYISNEGDPATIYQVSLN